MRYVLLSLLIVAACGQSATVADEEKVRETPTPSDSGVLVGDSTTNTDVTLDSGEVSDTGTDTNTPDTSSPDSGSPDTGSDTGLPPAPDSGTCVHRATYDANCAPNFLRYWSCSVPVEPAGENACIGKAYTAGQDDPADINSTIYCCK